MKLSLLFFVTASFVIQANESYSQKTKISLNRENTTVKEIIDEIETTTEFKFLFNTKAVDLNRRVSVKVQKVSVNVILDLLFKGSDTSYEIDDRKILLTKTKKNKTEIVSLPNPVDLPPIVVKGTVLDSKGLPVSGANVLVKGTNVATETDLDGNFSINVPDKSSKLVISYIGMESQEVAIGNSPLKIVLKDQGQKLDDVVVIGYGTQKKISQTGAITKIKTQELNNIPASNLSTLLANRASGVFVQTASGIPGRASIVKIRASSSWNGGTPLFVIDGVIRDQASFDLLDPSQIEDITILKDAASAAIYGSRSADGVLLVRTKVGKIGKPVVQFNSAFGVYSHPEIDDLYMDPNYGMDVMNAIKPGSVNDYDRAWVNKNNPDGRLWYNEAYENPTNQKIGLNISGGNEYITYFFGGSYYNENGFLPQVGYKKYNLRSNVQVKIAKDLTAGININGSNGLNHRFGLALSNSNADPLDVGQYYGILRYMGGGFTPPYIDGKPVSPGWLGGNAIDVMRNGGYWKKEDQKNDVLLSLEYKPSFIKGLSLKGSYSSNTDNTFIKTFEKKLINYHFKPDPLSATGSVLTNELVSSEPGGSPSQPYIGNENGKLKSYQINGIITYDTRFKDHHFNIVGVFEKYGSNYTFSKLYKYDFPYYTSDQFLFASPASTNTQGSGFETEEARLSYVGRLNYDYADKYLLSSSVRVDGSMKFAPNKRWGTFPSTSLGWVVSKENFFAESKIGSVIDFMKLRFSYGATGNDSVGGWQWKDLYNAATYPSGNPVTSNTFYVGNPGSQSSILQYGGIANPNLTWETSEAYNIGLDLTFFKNWNFTVEAWKKHSYNILGERILALPVEFGTNYPAENYGIVDAHGIEFELGYVNGTIGKDFTYNVHANFGLAETNVVKKDYAANSLPAQNPNGKPLNYLVGYQDTGIIRTQEDLNKLPAGYKIFGATPELGMMNFQDVSGLDGKPDGVIDSYDQVVIAKHASTGQMGVGNNAPMSYGLSMNFKYQRFSLDVLLGGLAGYKISYNDPFGRNAGGMMLPAYLGNAWSDTNPNGTAPKLFKNGDQRANGYVVTSTYNLYDGSFLRLKNINLSYDLPTGIVNKVGIGSAQIFAGASNLFCWTKFKFYDPEAYGFGTYPANTSVILGLNIQF
ncbi:SusC/RagA family TonB-linked outer membrane protein [Flavobacterium gilvum]|nr:TonB-dependent receptor [Flavobacterium gilvum]